MAWDFWVPSILFLVDFCIFHFILPFFFSSKSTIVHFIPETIPERGYDLVDTFTLIMHGRFAESIVPFDPHTHIHLGVYEWLPKGENNVCVTSICMKLKLQSQP